jgi:hypothetical protein
VLCNLRHCMLLFPVHNSDGCHLSGTNSGNSDVLLSSRQITAGLQVSGGRPLACVCINIEEQEVLGRTIAYFPLHERHGQHTKRCDLCESVTLPSEY